MSRSTRKEHLVQIPFTTGMDQTHDEHMAPLGALKRVTNMRAVSGGFLRKRVGFTTFAGSPPTNGYPVVSSTIPEKPTFVSRIGDANALGITSGAVFALDETDGGTAFQFVGRASSATPTRVTGALLGGDLTGTTGGFGRTPGAVAINSTGYVCVAGVSDASLVQAYIESPDGVRIWRLAEYSGTKVQVVAVDEEFIITVQSTTSIVAFRLTPHSSGVVYDAGSQPATVATLTAAGAHWDTTVYGSNWYIVYQNGAAQCTVAQMSEENVVNSATFSVTGTVYIAVSGISTMSAANAIWVGIVNDPAGTPAARYLVFSSTCAATLAATTIASVGASAGRISPPLFGAYYSRQTADADAAFFVSRFIESLPTSADDATYVGAVDALGNVVQGPFYLNGIIPLTKPDNYNRFWCMTHNQTANFVLAQCHLVRCEFAEGFIFDTPAPVVELSTRRFPAFGTTYGPSASNAFYHHIATGNGALPETSRSFAVLPIALTSVSGVPLASLELYEYRTAEREPHRAVLPTARGLLTSGQPHEFYGQTFNSGYIGASGPLPCSAGAGASEIGWPTAPVIVNSATAGGNVDAGARNYKAVYEWVDIYGKRHRSAPSAPFAVQLTTASQVTLTITSCQLTQRKAFYTIARPIILLYRQLANGASYKRLPGAVTAWDGTNTTEDFVDNNTDASIAGNESLYTDGGVLENVLAPSCQFFAQSETRVACGGLWDPTIVRLSKILVPEEQLAFSDDASFDVPLFAPCTGLAYMDGAFVAFTASSVLLITGEGPNDQGVGGFDTRYITKELGCIDYKSIVETNIGVIFQSADGYYLLPRGFGPPQAIGDAVRKDVHSGDAQHCLSAAAVTSEQTPDGAGGSTYAMWLTADLDATYPEFDDNDATSGVALSAGSSFSYSFSLGAGDNRLAIVMVGFEATGGVTVTGVSVTLGNATMDVLSNPGDTDQELLLFYLLERDLPPAETYTVTVSYTVTGTPGSATTNNINSSAVMFRNVRQKTPQVVVGVTGSGGTTSTSITTVGRKSLAVDFVWSQSSSSMTPDAGQTELVDASGGVSARNGISSEQAASPGSVTLGWTLTAAAHHQTVIELESLLSATHLLIYDTAQNRWFEDALVDPIAEIGAWSDGLALVTEDLDSDTEPAPIRYQNDITKTTEDGETFIEALIESHVFHPFGLGGWGLVRKLLVICVGSNYTLNVLTSVNGGDWQVSTRSVASAVDEKIRYHEVVLADPKCSTLAFKIFDSELSGDNTSFGVLGVLLEVEDSGGPRLIDPGERS